MTFIRAKNDRLYPAHRIVKAETRRGEGIIDMEIEGEGTVEFYAYEVRDYLRTPENAFPAQPGTHIIYVDEESPGGYWKMLVVGWAFCRDGKLYAVTADGVNDGVDSIPYIETPDLRVSQADGGSWDSIELMLASERAQLLAAE
jgi:hypothetical protein